MKNILVTIILPASGPEKKVVSEGQACQLPFQTRQKNRVARLSGIAGRIVVLLLAAAAPVLAQQTAAPAMSVCQARRVVNASVHDRWGSDAQISLGSIEIYTNSQWGSLKLNLKTLGAVTVKVSDPPAPQYSVLIDGQSPHWCEKGSNCPDTAILTFFRWFPDGYPAWNQPPDPQASARAAAFAGALNRLSSYARSHDPSRSDSAVCTEEGMAAAWRDFQQKAAGWRALPTKPPRSDEVEQHRLLAEDAYQQKQYDIAAAEFEAGTETDPLWWKGHYNAAVLYAQLKDYEDAVWHMRCYLELMPDAPDAQNAREHLLLWQGKLKQQAGAQ
jgi:hypothetical protein